MPNPTTIDPKWILEGDALLADSALESLAALLIAADDLEQGGTDAAK